MRGRGRGNGGCAAVLIDREAIGTDRYNQLLSECSTSLFTPLKRIEEARARLRDQEEWRANEKLWSHLKVNSVICGNPRAVCIAVLRSSRFVSECEEGKRGEF